MNGSRKFLCFFFTWNVLGKKTWDAPNISFLCMLTFFVMIFHLQVSEDIWRKVVEKIVDMSGKKLEKCLCLKPFNATKKKKIGTKKWEAELAFFVIRSPHNMWHFNKPCLQHFLRMMSKMWENDGYWCFVKMLSFVSKRFKMLEFTHRMDILFTGSQNFVF